MRVTMINVCMELVKLLYLWKRRFPFAPSNVSKNKYEHSVMQPHGGRASPLARRLTDWRRMIDMTQSVMCGALINQSELKTDS